MLGATESLSGRPSTSRSNTRPRLPIAACPLVASTRQSALTPLPAGRPLARGSPCRAMNASKVSRARSARSRASRSNPATRSGAAATKPSAPAAMMSGCPGRMCSPSM